MSTASVLQPPFPPDTPAPEEPLYEVVNGRRVELPPMSAYSTLIASRIVQELGPYAKARRLGTVVAEMLFILDPVLNLRRRPDVAFVSAERWPLSREIPEVGDWEVVPDLAIEAVSPHDLFRDVVAKMHEYFEKGVQQVWVVFPPKQQIFVFDSPNEVRILTAGQDLEGGTLLPGFRLNVASLFQRQGEAEARIS